MLAKKIITFKENVDVISSDKTQLTQRYPLNHYLRNNATDIIVFILQSVKFWFLCLCCIHPQVPIIKKTTFWKNKFSGRKQGYLHQFGPDEGFKGPGENEGCLEMLFTVPLNS